MIWLFVSTFSEALRVSLQITDDVHRFVPMIARRACVIRHSRDTRGSRLDHKIMIMVKRLDEVVPVRVTRKEKILLRRWARESGADVSKVIRDMIERRRSEEEDKKSIEDDSSVSGSSGRSSLSSVVEQARSAA